jgi:hypothetical protein
VLFWPQIVLDADPDPQWLYWASIFGKSLTWDDLT